MKKPILILAALAAVTSTAFAGDPPTYQQSSQQSFDGISMYNDHEFQLDIFGAYALLDDGESRLFNDDTAGGGVGFNYFITRHFGLGGEGMLFDTEGDTLGSTAINVFLRAPIGDSGLALYAFGGAGIIFNADDLDEEDFEEARDRFDDDRDANGTDDVIFEAHAGLGAEFRFTPNFGIFTDVRRTFVDLDDSDYTSGRVGIRIAF